MPRQPIEQLNRAHILYRKGDYKAALAGFTALLETYSSQKNLLIHVLDNRAATLIKLQRYDDALKDARTMIKSDKTISAGYLRAGQILRRQKQDEKASQIYELGIASVVDPAALKTLRAQAAEVKKYIVPDKAKDWLMTVLPLEILEMIIGMLELSEMVHLLRVCQTWKRVLTSMPLLWRNLDVFYPGNKKFIKHKILEVYASRSNWTFTKLHLPPYVSLGTLRMLLEKGKSLESLRLRTTGSPTDQLKYLSPVMDAKNLRHFHIGHTFVRFPRLFPLIHALPNLVSIAAVVESMKYDLIDLPGGRIPSRMQAVKFTHQPGSPAYCLGDLLADAVGLETLHLSNISNPEMDIRHLTHLKDVYMEFQRATGRLQFPSSVERLSLKGTHEFDYHLPPNALEDGRLSCLRYLKIFKGWTPRLAWELLHECGDQIQELDVYIASPEAFEYLGERIRNRKVLRLEKLSLDECNVNDRELGDIAQNCPKLHTCQLSNERYVTGSGIGRLVKGLQQLKYLTLRNIPEVSLDTVESARNQGIKVDHFTQAELNRHHRRETIV